jgi:hypothetical protein
MLGAESLQRRDDFLLILVNCVGDHTRGLFEAEASIAVSATHPFEDVKIIIFAGHTLTSIRDSGKANLLCRDQLVSRIGFA